jgi:hypothetical protein
MQSPFSAGARRLPSGAVEVAGSWTVAVRPGRVYLHPTGLDGALQPGAALELAAELHQAALDAERAELAQLAGAPEPADTTPDPAGRESAPVGVIS